MIRNSLSVDTVNLRISRQYLRKLYPGATTIKDFTSWCKQLKIRHSWQLSNTLSITFWFLVYRYNSLVPIIFPCVLNFRRNKTQCRRQTFPLFYVFYALQKASYSGQATSRWFILHSVKSVCQFVLLIRTTKLGKEKRYYVTRQKNTTVDLCRLDPASNHSTPRQLQTSQVVPSLTFCHLA